MPASAMWRKATCWPKTASRSPRPVGRLLGYHRTAAKPAGRHRRPAGRAVHHPGRIQRLLCLQPFGGADHPDRRDRRRGVPRPAWPNCWPGICPSRPTGWPAGSPPGSAGGFTPPASWTPPPGSTASPACRSACPASWTRRCRPRWSRWRPTREAGLAKIVIECGSVNADVLTLGQEEAPD